MLVSKQAEAKGRIARTFRLIRSGLQFRGRWGRVDGSSDLGILPAKVQVVLIQRIQLDAAVMTIQMVKVAGRCFRSIA